MKCSSVYGAAHSAELTGKQEKAASYHADLVKVTDPQSDRPEREAARKFLAKNGKDGTTAD